MTIRIVSLFNWLRSDKLIELRLVVKSAVLMNSSKVSSPFIATISLLKYFAAPMNQETASGRKTTCFIRVQTRFSDCSIQGKARGINRWAADVSAESEFCIKRTAKIINIAHVSAFIVLMGLPFILSPS